jgi:hypothetical protein
MGWLLAASAIVEIHFAKSGAGEIVDLRGPI